MKEENIKLQTIEDLNIQEETIINSIDLVEIEVKEIEPDFSNNAPYPDVYEPK